MKEIDLNKRIILALDVNTIDEAKVWVKLLKNKIKFYKVGYQLFLKGGLDFVAWLKDEGVDVMLDLKLFDIPRTVNAALNQVKDYTDYITVHSRDVILEKIPEELRSKILGVTVLTCFDDDDTKYECNKTVFDLVMKRIEHIIRYECAGVVMSGRELDFIPSSHKYKIIVPGIKLDKPRNDDQKRVVTYDDAFKNGADHIVVGRPILHAYDPLGLVDDIQEDMRFNFFHDRWPNLTGEER